MGRNSEHCDTRFSGMGWDPLLNCADIGIRERKTKQHYALAMMNHNKADTKKYKVCYMNAMASAMVADTDILIRSDDDKNEDFLFSDVQDNDASYAGTQLTNMVRKHIKLLHPDIPEKILLEYTGKSPRKGSITFGIIHRDLTLVEVAARSRHNIGGNMQTYIDVAGIAITLCSGLALNEYPDIRVTPYAATFDSLSGSDSLFIEYVVNELFRTNMIDFQSGGRLRPWLHGLGATLIMSYIEMEDDYGNKNIVVRRMEKVFQSKDGLTMEKLKSWSRSIAVDFAAKNTPVKLLNLTSCSDDVIDAMNRNTTMIMQMNTNNNSKEVEIDRKDKKIVALESTNVQQRITIEQQEKQIAQLELAAAATRTTTTTATRPLNNNSDTIVADIVLPSPPTKQNKNFLGSRSSLELPTKDLKMENILFTLKKDNILAKFISEEGEFLDSKTTQYFKPLGTERPKYKGVVELAFLAMTPAQLLVFRSKEEGNDFVELTTLCKNVEKQSVKLLSKMEDEETTLTSSADEETTHPSKPRKRKTIGTAWKGLGGRFNEHKRRKFSVKDSHKQSYYSLDPKNTPSSSSATDVAASSTSSLAASTAATSSTTNNHAATAAATAAATTAAATAS